MALPRGAARIPVEVTKTREATQKMKRVKRELKGVGTEAKKTGKSMGTIRTGATAMASGFVVASAAIAGAVVVARSAIRAFSELADRGGTFSAVSAYYERMADPALLARLQELSGFQLRQLDIMRGYSQVMDVALVSAHEYEEWMRRTVAYAQARGRDVTTTWELVQGVLAGGGMERLREMGINVAELRDAVRESGGSFETTAGKARGLNLALEQLRTNQGEVSNSAAHVGDALTRLKTKASDAFDQFARGFVEGEKLHRVFEILEADLAEQETSWERLGETLSNVTADMAGSFRDTFTELGNINRVAAITEAHMRAIYGPLTELSAPETMTTLSLTVSRPEEVEPEPDAEVAATAIERMADAIRVRGAARAQAAREQAAAAQRFSAAQRGRTSETAALQAEADRAEIEQAQRALELTFEQIDADHVYHEYRLEMIATEKELRTEANRTALEEAGEAQRKEIEVLEELQEKQEAAQAAALERQAQTVQSVVRVSDASMQLMSKIGAVIAANVENTERAAAVEGAFIIAVDTVKAGFEAVQAVAAFASQRYVSGAMHLIAAAGYAANAALAASELGGGSGSAATASSASYRPAETQVDQPTESGERTTVINYSLGRVHAELGQQLERAQWERNRQGLASPGSARKLLQTQISR